MIRENSLILGSERWLNFLENAADGLQLSLTLFSRRSEERRVGKEC